MLLALASSTPDSGTRCYANDSDGGYIFPPVSGAMYLLVASAAHDVRAGFSLLVGRSCGGHCAFGVGLLNQYGIMNIAAMTVLVST